jgi:hypothetical protein
LPSTNPCGIAFGAKIEYLKYGEYFSLIIIEKFFRIFSAISPNMSLLTNEIYIFVF